MLEPILVLQYSVTYLAESLTQLLWFWAFCQANFWNTAKNTLIFFSL